MAKRRRKKARDGWRMAHSDELEGSVREEMLPLVEAHAIRVRDYYAEHRHEEGAASVLRWWRRRGWTQQQGE